MTGLSCLVTARRGGRWFPGLFINSILTEFIHRARKNFTYFDFGCINEIMPNQRAAGQKAVIVMMSEEFLDLIDASLPVMGYSDRSSFIREAVRVKLGAPPLIAAAPSRAGKGGRPKSSDVRDFTALVSEGDVEYKGTKKNSKKGV